jgi:hypothetical protein
MQQIKIIDSGKKSMKSGEGLRYYPLYSKPKKACVQYGAGPIRFTRGFILMLHCFDHGAGK